MWASEYIVEQRGELGIYIYIRKRMIHQAIVTVPITVLYNSIKRFEKTKRKQT